MNMPNTQFSVLHLPPPVKFPRPSGAHLISGRLCRPPSMLLLLVVVVLLLVLLLLLITR